MTEGIRQRLISQLTNLKKQNKKTASLDVDFVLKALAEPESMPAPKPKKPGRLDADAGYFKD